MAKVLQNTNEINSLLALKFFLNQWINNFTYLFIEIIIFPIIEDGNVLFYKTLP